MHGKATLILTDKDTGRVVERREEHNLVTKALEYLFSLPPEIGYSSGSMPYFNGYLPLYKNALKGLILFGDAIPENAYDYMLGGKYRYLATAGDAYSGADAMRGSFNENQSCEIENGYRFVWDFAPEKAVGTIRCLALTNHFCGNFGNAALPDTNDAYFMISPTDLTAGSNVNITIPGNGGYVFLQKGRNLFYSYKAATGTNVIVYKYRLPDMLALKICDKLTPVVESETQIDLGFSSAVAVPFYDPITERLYFIQVNYSTIGSTSCYKFKYAAINPFTGEKIYSTPDFIQTEIPWSRSSSAIMNEKLYLVLSDGKICVCSLSGVVEKTIDLDVNTFYAFLAIDGKLAVDCKLSSTGRRCIRFIDEPRALICWTRTGFYPIPSGVLTAPYCFARNSTASNADPILMLRTDYLATINNLASPLVKTDQHALQVRYEITN